MKTFLIGLSIGILFSDIILIGFNIKDSIVIILLFISFFIENANGRVKE